MAVERNVGWRPDWSVPPGEILLEALQEREISQSELARRLNRPIKTINEIVNGKASITPESAIQLERALGISARFWIGLEGNYRETLARQAALQELEKETPWLSAFPLREMVRHGILPSSALKAETANELLGFFGVGTKKAWETHWGMPAASLRASAHQISAESLAAWLRWGEIEASQLEVSTFDRLAFKASLPGCRSITRIEPFSAAVERIRQVLAGHGVALVVIPELPRAPVSGAARWLRRNRPLIQLSLRLKSDDQFWFTLFHEAGHIANSSRQADHLDIDEVDGTSATDGEAEADLFARDLLVPQAPYERFLAQRELTPASIKSFAREIDVSPGIVVGRLQRDRYLELSSLNRLKKSIRWATLLKRMDD